ncbi:MAG: hypothetical protein GF375_05830 [Candidatus Omnitrophica bacterium]|nr:hypothetical protein [Candidatus Omnitrophota bacterium]MBD3269494.1 hypothetical protein [Candidatus Omnitrophota bacterium]
MENYGPREIVGIAVNVEKAGIGLYGELEKRAGNNKVREIWNYLRLQEENHKRMFENLLKDLPESPVYEVKSGEYETYLRAIASNYVFTLELIEEKKRELFSSDLEAVDFGIYIEKESILTYSALKEYLETKTGPVLENIIREEKRHLADLTLLKEELKKGGE